MAVDWLTALLAFAGGAVGAALAYAAAVRGDRQRETAARREEWGRRFTAALADLGDDSPRRRRLGQVLLTRLAQSALASGEERQLAEAVLEEAATSSPAGVEQVFAARALIELTGPDHVSPLIRDIADASPPAGPSGSGADTAGP